MGETPAWWQVTGLSGCCGWNSGLGAGKEGEWSEGRLDPFLIETGQAALLLLAGSERNSSPDLA